MTLADLGKVLDTVTERAYHYTAPPGEQSPYIVWAEDGQADARWTNDRMEIQVLTGTVDLYTMMEYDPLFDAVQDALNDGFVSWRLNSVQHEDDTGLIHFEWVWWING